MFRGMWDLPGQRIEPVSLALAGGFLTTAPPGKSLFVSSSISFIKVFNVQIFHLPDKFIPKYFIVLDPIVNGIVFFIFQMFH